MIQQTARGSVKFTYVCTTHWCSRCSSTSLQRSMQYAVCSMQYAVCSMHVARISLPLQPRHGVARRPADPSGPVHQPVLAIQL